MADTVISTVRFSKKDKTKERLNSYAKEMGITINDAMVQLIEQGLQEYEKSLDDKKSVTKEKIDRIVDALIESWEGEDKRELQMLILDINSQLSNNEVMIREGINDLKEELFRGQDLENIEIIVGKEKDYLNKYGMTYKESIIYFVNEILKKVIGL